MNGLQSPFNPSGCEEEKNGFRAWSWQIGGVPICQRNKRNPYEAAAWTSHLIHAANLTGTEHERAQRALHRLGFEHGEAAALHLHVLREQCRTDTPQRRAVLRLAALATQGPVHLQCWCTPRPCHAEHIRAAILGYAQALSRPA
ncbi:hypothetical protein IHN32_01065 [Deinococcus sp. 14RED07]|uniref:hypothetical protein n=1 Tax=unclassified Deinococcus TaxID=2623546 RepID=UPI001E4E94C8|nr:MULTISPECIES: hypothetical protein [unclassified Deinococcus]MCD0164111.1 hypothetical protein [Deinococcus sp. 12RED42]MCD0174546.1 hypothetical protein [Deinococcus sp. 14RED07]